MLVTCSCLCAVVKGYRVELDVSVIWIIINRGFLTSIKIVNQCINDSRGLKCHEGQWVMLQDRYDQKAHTSVGLGWSSEPCMWLNAVCACWIVIVPGGHMVLTLLNRYSALPVTGWRHFHSVARGSLTPCNYFYTTWPQIEGMNIGLYFLWMLSFKKLFMWVIKQGPPPSVTKEWIISQGRENICSQLKSLCDEK